jgi:hypothetical protein
MFTIKRTPTQIHITGLRSHSVTPIPASAETGHTYDSIQSAFDEARLTGTVCRTCAIAAQMILNRNR